MRAPRRPLKWFRELRPGLALYVTAIDVVVMSAVVVGGVHTQWHVADVLIALLLVAGAAANVEALRRVGEPAGPFTDLQAAWTLPMVLLLPPIYALLAPLPLTLVQQFAVRASPWHRRIFSAAAIGLANLAAAVVFRVAAGVGVWGPVQARLWLHQPMTYAALGLAVAVLGVTLNNALVFAAVHLSSPEVSLREMVIDRESRVLDGVELSCGLLVTLAAVISPPLALVAIPPMMLLQRSILHGQLTAAARTDLKTGLLNAATWTKEAETHLAAARRSGAPVGIVLIDLDFFKMVNDTHGHLIGDRVLREVAQTIQAEVRSYDVAGRFGGEEFVLLLPGAGPLRAQVITDRLRRQIEVQAVATDDGRVVKVTMSAGIAIFDGDGCDVTELLHAADAALYRAKAAGRNRVYYSRDLGVDAVEG